MNFPKELKYTKGHEWAKVEGSTLTVGITEHAQHSLGDVVYVELPAVGRALKSGETFGVVESIKAVSDLYSPATGKVTAINSALIENPSQINQDPYGAAWMVKIELDDPSAVSKLMDSDAYTKYVQNVK